MIESWRWFGPHDPVTLNMIRQAGAAAVVTSLHHIPVGLCWTREEIRARRDLIEAAGLEWAVVESVPVHPDIKAGGGELNRHLEAYGCTLENLGAEGITTVCYNFMPVVDWTRTSLLHETESRALTLRFDTAEFAAYDLFILARDGAVADYSEPVLERARAVAEALDAPARERLERNIIAGLPGGYGSYDRESLRTELSRYRALGVEGLRANLYRFLDAVLPCAERAGVRLCIHPDDPPFSLFGLPRILSVAADARDLFERFPSPNNGLTLCAGSFGARGDNDLVDMVREFGPRIFFAHLRNVSREEDGSFVEADHLGGDTDMVGLIQAFLDEERRRRRAGEDALIPMRPDHGVLIGEEQQRNDVNPGYSFAGRLKALAELRGVIHALEAFAAAGLRQP